MKDLEKLASENAEVEEDTEFFCITHDYPMEEIIFYTPDGGNMPYTDDPVPKGSVYCLGYDSLIGLNDDKTYDCQERWYIMNSDDRFENIGEYSAKILKKYYKCNRLVKESICAFVQHCLEGREVIEIYEDVFLYMYRNFDNIGQITIEVVIKHQIVDTIQCAVSDLDKIGNASEQVMLVLIKNNINDYGHILPYLTRFNIVSGEKQQKR